MDRPILHSNFARPLADNKTSQTSSSMSSTTSASASAATTAATGITTTAAAATSQASTNANASSTSTIQYDHETYLELLAGRSSHVEKTASQIYKEERARKLSLRAQDPAVLTGPLDLNIDGFGAGDSTRY